MYVHTVHTYTYICNFSPQFTDGRQLDRQDSPISSFYSGDMENAIHAGLDLAPIEIRSRIVSISFVEVGFFRQSWLHADALIADFADGGAGWRDDLA